MIHYLTDERLKKTAPGHEKDAQMTALEVKSVYLVPSGRSQVYRCWAAYTHIFCIINCYFAFLLLLSIVIAHIEV